MSFISETTAPRLQARDACASGGAPNAIPRSKNDVRARRGGSRKLSPADTRAHLLFALMWATYGDAGNEYIFPTFGILPTAFYRRVLGIITAGHVDSDLDPEALRRLARACARRAGL